MGWLKWPRKQLAVALVFSMRFLLWGRGSEGRGGVPVEVALRIVTEQVAGMSGIKIIEKVGGLYLYLFPEVNYN